MTQVQSINLVLQIYSEVKLNEFMAAKENILLVEYFLQNQK